MPTPQGNAWGVWMYGLTGAGSTVAFGAVSLYFGSFLVPKRKSKDHEENALATTTSAVHPSPQASESNAAAVTAGDAQGWEQLSALIGLENYGRSLKRKDDGSPTLTQTIVGSALLCTGLFLMNMRTVSIWRGRKMRGNLDAEAFIRGFDKFMHEQAGQGGASGRAGGGAEGRRKTRDEFDRFWREFEREERAQEERRQRMHEEFNQRRAEQEREFGGTESADPWQSPQVRDALRQLGLSSEHTLSAKALKTAYLKAAKESHPDRVPAEDKAAAGERFKRISAAYALLRMRVADS